MIRLAVFLIWCASGAVAQGTFGLTAAEVRETRDGIALTLTLDGITPYRVFTLDAPRRLVLDVEGLATDSAAIEGLAGAETITLVRAGPFRPGWTRLIFDLAAPMNIATAGMIREGEGARLTINLDTVTAEDFAQAAGAPADPGWDVAAAYDPADARRLADSTDFVVVLDAAHGGIETGDEVEGISEADLALIMAEELRVRLNAIDGVTAILTRDGDVFVPDLDRFELARSVGADLVISFHADDTHRPGLRVASFAPGADGLDDHDYELPLVDPLADQVQQVLGDLGRAETLPAADRIADALASDFGRSGIPVQGDARFGADLPILSEPGFPAVVVVLGGLGHAPTRAYLASPEGRNAVAETIAETIRLLAR